MPGNSITTMKKERRRLLKRGSQKVLPIVYKVIRVHGRLVGEAALATGRQTEMDLLGEFNEIICVDAPCATQTLNFHKITARTAKYNLYKLLSLLSYISMRNSKDIPKRNN